MKFLFFTVSIFKVEHVRSERNLLAEVDSRCIVQLFYSFQDSDFLYLIMEYLPGGDIMTLLMREDILSEDVARFYIAESILAIHSIHQHNYVHRYDDYIVAYIITIAKVFVIAICLYCQKLGQWEGVSLSFMLSIDFHLQKTE